MKILKLTKEEWNREYAESAHLISFSEMRNPDSSRLDFALLAVSDEGIPMGYITAMEFSDTHLYWQYGGAFPGTLATANVYRGYEKCKGFCMLSYNSISTFIENTNVVMLKMAMKLGFRVVGLKTSNNKVYLELFLSGGWT